jgi:hypothetical protein
MISPWRDAVKDTPQDRRAIIVAGMDEANRIKEVINRSREQIQIIGLVTPEEFSSPTDISHLGTLSNLPDVIRVHQIREIIFSAQDVPFSRFTASMTSLGPGFRYMLAASHTMNIVGSMNKDTEGESYGLRVHFRLSHPASRRSKRIVDILVSICCLGLSPLWVWIIPGRGKLLSHSINTLIGRKTWVGYHPGDEHRQSLPPLREGVISPAGPFGIPVQTRRLEHIHYVYARDYHWTTDISLILQHWKALGKTSGYEGN